MKSALVINYDSQSNKNIHTPFHPEDVRSNDPVKARILINDTQLKLDVWKISPFGIELVCENYNFDENDKTCNVEVTVGIQSTSLNGRYVHSYQFQGKTIACVRFIYIQEERNEKERRASSRWTCSNEYFPTGIATSPAKFNDFIYFKVKDISYGGIRFTCSLRNKFIFPKMQLTCLINFPMTSQIKMNIKIENISIQMEDDKEILSVGGTYDVSDIKNTKVISEYILQFGSGSTPAELRKEGFPSENISHAIDFQNTKTKEQYENCLKLRLLANSSEGKLIKDMSYDDMADEFDVRSRIIFGTHDNQTVCTVRVAFHEANDTMEVGKYIELPESFPRKEDCVEIMRLCTHPEYRGSNLLMSLFKYLAIIVAQSKRKYIVTSCVEKLVPLYKKIGFKSANLSYTNPLFPNHPDHIMIAKVETLMFGRNMNPIIWNIVWGDLYQYFEENGIMEYTPLDKLRLKSMKALKPISKLLTNKKKKTKK